MSGKKLVELAPPGAGIPAPEKAVGGALLKVLAALRSTEGLLAAFEDASETLLATAGSVAREQLTTRVLIRRLAFMEDSSRRWSVAMTVSHVTIVNAAVLGLIQNLAAGKSISLEVRTADVKPRASAGSEALEALEAGVKTFTRTLDGQDLKRVPNRHPHPWFGPITPQQWLALAVVHTKLHLRQVSAISAKLPST